MQTAFLQHLVVSLDIHGWHCFDICFKVLLGSLHDITEFKEVLYSLTFYSFV
jgi:hypothetical protein